MDSDRFARLCEIPPVEIADPPPRRLDSESEARAWVQALPRANPQQTQTRLRGMLRALTAGSLPPGRRFAVLEQLRVPVLEAVALLEREFVGGSLPLPPSRARAARDAEDFHRLLGHGYRRAAAEYCRGNGRPPLLGSVRVARALHRAVCHYAFALMVAWRVYRQPGGSIWAGLHRSFWFGEQLGLCDRAIEDPRYGGRVCARSLYIKTLITALANPSSYSQGEQVELGELAAAYADQCPLSLQRRCEQCLPVPVAEDHPPGIDREAHDGPWLDLARLDAAIAGVLASGDQTVLELSPRRGVHVRVSREMLVRLRRSLARPAERDFPRLDAGHLVEAVIGLSSLHYFLAGGLDFDNFVRRCVAVFPQSADRAVWAHGAGENSRVPVLPARVLDQSLGGYGLSWQSNMQVRARVGELLGLTFAGAGERGVDWMVGLIRWLRHGDNGEVVAGIELLARRAHAVGLQVNAEDGKPRPLVRAIELEHLDTVGERCFLISNEFQLDRDRVEVVRSRESDPLEDEQALAPTNLKLHEFSRAGEYVALCGTPWEPVPG